MKIHKQFLIFVVGIVLMPVCILILFGLVQYSSAPERTMIPGYDDMNLFVQATVSEQSWQAMKNRLERNPSYVQVAILNTSYRVLYSSIPQIPEQVNLSPLDLMQFMRFTGDHYMYQLESSPERIENGLFVIMRTPRNRMQKINLFRNGISVFLLILLGMIVLAPVTSAFIARNITRSVTEIEEATARLAQGNLDEEIVVKGSNEISSLSQSLNALRLAFKDHQLRQSRFIMGISHDLRTPVALIKGYTESIADGFADDPETLDNSLNIIIQKADQLQDMIDELINFVKLGTEDWRRTITFHNITPFLTEYGKRIQADGALLKKDVAVQISLPEELDVRYDEKLFLRVLENLTGNAMRYTQDGGRIQFKAGISDNTLKISIADNGYGISRDDIAYIFDPFYRGTSSRREEGKGLGLSVVKNIVDSHNWHIDVSSDLSLDMHTIFTITIPLSA